jgi:hypothetical protein
MRTKLSALIAITCFGFAPDWPVRPQSALSGDFGVIQFATNNPERMLAAWRKTTPGARLDVTHEARFGQPLSNFINFKNCRPDRRGLCNLTTEWSLKPPGGTFKAAGVTQVLVAAAPPPGGAIGLSSAALQISFGKPDPPGNWIIRARTTDHVARITLQTEDVISVRP